MTPDELMKPRFQVIADYPGSLIKPGDLLVDGMIDNKPVWQQMRNGIRLSNSVHGPEFYPHLFKLIEWWERRSPEEMPEYVKEGEIVNKATWKTEYKGITMKLDSGEQWRATNNTMCFFEPATLEEYTQYINSKK
jgi:hypothetical protein